MAGHTPTSRTTAWVRMGLALAGVGAAGLPTLVVAQEAPAASTVLFDALIADLAAGNRQAAINRISSVESITDLPMPVTNRIQFVDRVLGCPAQVVRQSTLAGTPLLDVEWRCATGKITARLGSVVSPRYIEVIDVADEAELARRATQRMLPSVPPPAPPARTAVSPEQAAAAQERARQLAAQQAQVLSNLGAAVQAGALDGVADSLTAGTQFTYGYRDPFNSVNINDLQGSGIGAGREQLAAAIAQLGTPIDHSCEPGRINVCRWSFAGGDRSLLALIFFRGGSRIANVQWLYTTPESIAMAAQNATPEQIAAFMAAQQAGGAN